MHCDAASCFRFCRRIVKGQGRVCVPLCGGDRAVQQSQHNKQVAKFEVSRVTVTLASAEVYSLAVGWLVVDSSSVE
jgi:hypothetical protein